MELGVLALKRPRAKKFISFFNLRLSKRRFVNYGLVVGNIILLTAVSVFIFTTPKNATSSQYVTPSTLSTSSINPLDQLSSANIALTVARMTNLPEATAVSNQADSETALLSVATDNNSIISKPQVVATNYVSNKDIKTYIVKPGDSISSIAQKFNVSTNSILWSNNITGNNVTPGVKLLIPPVSGIVYTVKKGDTPSSIAQKYQSSQSLLVAYNDAELKGIYPGERIIIPNGTIPSVINYNYAGSATYAWGYNQNSK